MSKPTLFPVLSLLFSSIIWGTSWYPLRLLDNAGLNGIWQTLIIYFAIVIFYSVFVHSFMSEYKQVGIRFLLMILAVGWCNLAFFLAMLDGQVLRVLLLFFLSPLWSIALAYWIVHESISKTAMVGLFFGMVGMVVMLLPGVNLSDFHIRTADLLALSSGFTFALGNVLARYHQNISVNAKAYAGWWGVVIVSAIMAYFSGEQVPHVNSLFVWPAAALMGLLLLLPATMALTYGVSRLPVQQSSVILLFEIVVGGISAWLLAGEIMMLNEWVGGAMILLAGIIVQISSSNIMQN
jgi:drug/metabolite transporter (DMT)-like permease